jgi:DNA-directed RNA polymerase II subunit RPB1
VIKNLIVIPGEDIISREAQDDSIIYLSAMIKFFLSSKKVCIKLRLSPEMLNEILGEIESKF